MPNRNAITMVPMLMAFGLLVAGAQRGRATPFLVIFGVVSLLTVIFLFRDVIKKQSAPTLDPTAVPIPLADVKVGVAQQTTGLVGVGEEPHHAPLDAGAVCVFHRIVVENVDTRRVELETRSSDTLVLDDGQGARVTVHLEGAKWDMSRNHEIESSPSRPNDHVVEFLKERAVNVRDAIRVRVEWIAAHELVFVRGMIRERKPTSGDGAYRASELTVLEMRAEPNAPLVISLDELPEKSSS